MSNAPAAAAEAPVAPAKGGKKKLIIIAAAVAVLLAGGGGAAFMLMKKKAHVDEDGADGAATAQADAPKAKAKHDAKHPPTFVPLDPFTVNLADREAERYAQVAVTLEVVDSKVSDELKIYMPAVRNNILMVLSHKTSTELLEMEGKTKLALEIRRETARALGVELDDPEEEDSAAEGAKGKKKAKKKKVEVELPITAVHFSNFIIQ